MYPVEFGDKAAPPSPRALAAALGKAAPAWEALLERLHRDAAPLQEEWGFSGAKYGWSLRLKRGKRVIVYLAPYAGAFVASFALGGSACAAAREAKLPAATLAALEAAPRYAEGRGVKLPVTGVRQIGPVAALAAIKLAH